MMFAILILRSLAKSSQCNLMMHTKARTLAYPGTDVKRFPVPSEFVDWKVPFPEYKPVDYTSKQILRRPPYADPEIRYYMQDLYLKCKQVTIGQGAGHDSQFTTSDTKDETARLSA